METIVPDRSRDFAPHFQARRIEPCSRLPPSVLREAFALRYEVYCAERGFLNADDHPDGLEYDAFDDVALHCLAHDRAFRLAGYVRLIRGGHGTTMPWQTHCRDLLPGVALPDPAFSAEVSRLMVRPEFRRRRGDLLAGVNADTLTGSENQLERRVSSPQIMLCLFRQMYQHSMNHGILYWYAAMERSLVRALQGMGFAFRQIGPSTDYFGPVAPYLASLPELTHVLESADPALLSWMRGSEFALVP